MTRNMACSLALGALALLVPSASVAQTFVDVGVWTRGGGGRVVVGGAPVYSVPVYYPPVYYPPVYYSRPIYPRPIYRPVYVAPQYYRYDRGRHLGWYKNGKARGPYRGRYYDRYNDGYGRYDRRR